MLKTTIFAIFLMAICGSAYITQEEVSDDYLVVYLIKSLSGNRVPISEYSQYIYELRHGNMTFAVESLNNLHGTSLNACDKDAWLVCGLDVLGCVEKCKNGTLGECIDCLGGGWKQCCPCVQEYAPKVPCQSS